MSGGTIYLVRHGETEWNRLRRYQGWSDSPLTEQGRTQARAIGQLLRQLPATEAAELVASPTGRARHTADIIRQCLGRAAPLHLDARLREISLGSWDGLYRAQIAARAPGIFDADGYHEWYFRTPDGESYDAFAGRLADWLGETGGRSIIAVTHGVVTRVLRGLYAGLPRAEALALAVPQDRLFKLADGVIEEIAAEPT